VGQIKNGGAATTGAGRIDLDYLLGANGGHMNIKAWLAGNEVLLPIVHALHAPSES
jgi:hypothetical protein